MMLNKIVRKIFFSKTPSLNKKESPVCQPEALFCPHKSNQSKQISWRSKAFSIRVQEIVLPYLMMLEDV